MKKFIGVFGTHGAGKTTLVKNIIMSDFVKDFVKDSDGDFLLDCFDFYEKKNEYGAYTVSKGGKFVAVGSYSTKCGGADLYKNVEDYYKQIEFLSEKYPNSDLCVEGVIQRAIGDLTACYENLQGKGYAIYLILLSSNADVCFKRVCERSKQIPNMENITSKISNIGKLFEKLRNCGKFNCFEIDTSGKTTEEVYQKFLQLTQ